MKKLKPILILLTFTLEAIASDFQDFDPYQEKITRQQAIEKLEKYLVKEKEIEDYYAVTEDAFVLFDSPESKASGKEEYRLIFSKQSSLNERKNKNLQGLKVAIDPGHFGEKYAYLEQRFVEIPLDSSIACFNEGTLTFLTALHLKTLLEQEGAQVMLTKEHLGTGAILKDFFDWLKETPAVWKEQKTLSQLFREKYNPLDLKARAEKINQFAPDITVIIHYNAHDSTDKSSPYTKPTEQNYNMTFLAGAFCKKELVEKEARYEFLRLLVTQDIENSQLFCQSVLDQMIIHLQVPAVIPEDGARYLDNACLPVSKGVYARNLALTRLVHGTLCYGESLVQNNPKEAVNLSKQDTVIGGIPCSSRLKEVAEAYFDAIKLFANNNF